MAVLLGTTSDLGRHRVITAHAVDGVGAWVNAEGPTWVAVWGTWAGGVVTIEVSFDGGATAIPLAPNTTGVPISLSSATAMIVPGEERGLLMRSRCTGITSGTVNVRISGGFR